MSDGGVTLIEALNISIDRIKAGYNGNWAVIGDVRGKVLDIPEMPESINEFLEEVWGPQIHNYTEICICFEGNLAMLLEENIVSLEQGDVCFILPGVRHCEMLKKNSSYMAVWISIGLNRFAMHLSGKDSVTGQFYTVSGCTLNSGANYSDMINTIKGETGESLAYSSEIVKLNIMQLLISIYRKVCGASYHSNTAHSPIWHREGYGDPGIGNTSYKSSSSA